MNAVLNLLRVLCGVAWTGLVGGALLVVVFTTYVIGRGLALLGMTTAFDRILQGNMYLMSSVARSVWAPIILGVCGISVRREDEAPIDWNRDHVICANHASIFDIVALARVIPPPFRFVAKRELLRWPILGWALVPSGQIVINRADRQAAVRQLEREAERGIRGHVIFFVEGTRSRDGKLMEFKKGAFHFAADHKLPALPTAVCGSFGVLGRVAWWRLHPGRDIVIRLGRPIAAQRDIDPSAAAEIMRTETRASIARHVT